MEQAHVGWSSKTTTLVHLASRIMENFGVLDARYINATTMHCDLLDALCTFEEDASREETICSSCMFEKLERKIQKILFANLSIENASADLTKMMDLNDRSQKLRSFLRDKFEAILGMQCSDASDSNSEDESSGGNTQKTDDIPLSKDENVAMIIVKCFKERVCAALSYEKTAINENIVVIRDIIGSQSWKITDEQLEQVRILLSQ